MANLFTPYRTVRTRHAVVRVIGLIWQPGLTCAMNYTLSDYDLENIGEFTRENIDRWLSTHAGDFSRIIGFQAECGEGIIAWESEDNECTYSDCMYRED